jgi:hypothetical protein
MDLETHLRQLILLEFESQMMLETNEEKSATPPLAGPRF